MSGETRSRIVALDRRYRSSWDCRAIGYVVGVGPTTVARILREERGPRPARPRPAHERRTRMLRRDVMWSTDGMDLPGGGKLIKTLDEMSRYRPGWSLAASEGEVEVLRHAEDVVARMGRAPLVWKHDHGSGFKSHAFQKFLRRHGVVAYPTPPRAPWTNGRTERDNRDVRSWLINREMPGGTTEGLDLDIDEGLTMLNHIKPRAVLSFQTSACAYFNALGVEDLDRGRFRRELEEQKAAWRSEGEEDNERLHRRAVRVILERWGLYEEWEVRRTGAQSVNRFQPSTVAF